MNMQAYSWHYRFIRSLKTFEKTSALSHHFLTRNSTNFVQSTRKNGFLSFMYPRQIPVCTSLAWRGVLSSGISSEADDGLSDEESIDEIFLDDSEYGQMLQDNQIHKTGHNVFVVQPVYVSEENGPTTGELQLEESIGLIRSLSEWSVAGSVIYRVHGRCQKSRKVLQKSHMMQLREIVQTNRNISAVFVSVDCFNSIQLKKLQTELGVPVLDRYSVVIQIFREYARTQEAKLQVSVAELEFLKSRLTEVQEGRETTADTEIMGGTGQTFIQARRIILRRRERKLSQELEALRQQRHKLREGRIKREMPTVAVVGYTNSGKTTLIKALTGDERMVPANRLFATLDVTIHAGFLPNTMKALFVDTVGFISNIPNSLLKAFSATLEDAISADLVIHVEDKSNPDWALQRENVLGTLRSMLTTTQFDTMLHVGNKIDKLDRFDMERELNTMYVSAVTGYGLEALREEVQTRLLKNTGFLQKKVRIPLNGDHLSYLYKVSTVVSTEDDESKENLIVNIIISEKNFEQFKHRFGVKKRHKIPSFYQH